MPTQKKIESVHQLSEKLSRTKSIVLADYRGLTHKQLEELRRMLRKVKAEFVVTKNRLFLRALGVQADRLKGALKDETAVLFSFEDEIAPIRELLKFFKIAGIGKPKTGLLGELTLSEEEIVRLSSLPTKEVLISQLAARFQGPILNMHYALSWNLNKLVYALNAIKNQKTN